MSTNVFVIPSHELWHTVQLSNHHQKRNCQNPTWGRQGQAQNSIHVSSPMSESCTSTELGFESIERRWIPIWSNRGAWSVGSRRGCRRISLDSKEPSARHFCTGDKWMIYLCYLRPHIMFVWCSFEGFMSLAVYDWSWALKVSYELLSEKSEVHKPRQRG